MYVADSYKSKSTRKESLTECIRVQPVLACARWRADGRGRSRGRAGHNHVRRPEEGISRQTNRANSLDSPRGERDRVSMCRPMDDARATTVQQGVNHRAIAAVCVCNMAHFYAICSIFSYAGFLAVDCQWAADEDRAGFVAGLLPAALLCGRLPTSAEPVFDPATRVGCPLTRRTPARRTQPVRRPPPYLQVSFGVWPPIRSGAGSRSRAPWSP